MAATSIIPVDQPDYAGAMSPQLRRGEPSMERPAPDPHGARYPAMAQALLKRGLIDQPQNMYDTAGNLARTWALTRVADGRGGTLRSVLAQALGGDGNVSRFGETMPANAAGTPSASPHDFAYGQEMPAPSAGSRYRSATQSGLGWSAIR